MTGTPSISHKIIPEAPNFRGLLSSKRLQRLTTLALDLIYPPRCASCGRIDTAWCKMCQAQLDSQPVQLLQRQIPPLTAAATAPHEGILQHVIHALKYDNQRSLAAPLAARLHQALDQLHWAYDLIIPAPLHADRQAWRGYNQATLLAQELAHLQQKPCYPLAITRTRNTPSQVGLNPTQRRDNMINAFRAEPTLLHHSNVLLVDDVCTTGATLAACANAAIEAGALHVYALTVTVAL